MSFAALGLKDVLLLTLSRLRYEVPTTIQARTIPAALAGHDILAAARKGSGKTAAFALPVIQHLMQEHPRLPDKTVRSLILTPDHELAEAVYRQLKYYGMGLPVRTVVAHAGAAIALQAMKLQCGADILVATPDRLEELYHRKAVDFSKVRTVVIDAADQLLDLGYARKIKELMQRLPEKRQTLLFSSTLSKDIRSLAENMLHRPLTINAPQRRSAGIHKPFGV